jgi:hypothetical protein
MVETTTQKKKEKKDEVLETLWPEEVLFATILALQQ